MTEPRVDDRVADALRWLGERGEPRGIDEILTRAAEAVEPVVVAPGPRRPARPFPRRVAAVAVAAAALVLLAVVVVRWDPVRVVDDVGTGSQPGSAVSSIAPPAPSTAAPTTSTTAQPTGCAVAAPCALPDHVTDVEARHLPAGWPAAPLPHVDLHPLVPWRSGPTVLQHQYQSPTKDLPSPGGLMARSIIVTLFTDGGAGAGQDRAGRGEEVRELVGGRRMYVGTTAITGGNGGVDVAIVRVFFGDGRWLHVAGTGVDRDELVAVTDAIVVR